MLKACEKKDPRPHLEVLINDTKFTALVDSGAVVSVISQELFHTIPHSDQFRPVEVASGFEVSGVGGGKLKVKGRFQIPFSTLGVHAEHPFYVIEGLANHSLICGVDLIRAMNMAITADTVQLRTVMPAFDPDSHPIFALTDFVIPARTIVRKKLHLQANEEAPKTGETVLINPNFQLPHAWEGVQEVGEDGAVWVVLSNLLEEDMRVNSGEAIALVERVDKQSLKPLDDEQVAAMTRGKITDDKEEPFEGPAEKMNEEDEKYFLENLKIECSENEEKKKYLELCTRFHDVFSKSKHDIGRANVISHVIKLKDESADPVHQKQFPIPMAHKEAIYGWVDKLLAQGAIELSKSSFNSPIFGVKKKSGETRVVQDFRAVNLASVPDKYVIRDPRECIDEIGQEASCIFSAIDLTSGFWQQNLEEDSRAYTAFTVPGKGTRYQWTVNPMGLQGAPASFARMMDYVFRGLARVITYIDDVLIHSKTHEEQRESLEKVFLRMRKYGLKINTKKSFFAAPQCEYLGYHISGKGASPGTEKLEAMRKFPEPDSLKKIKEFLGCAQYFRFMIPKFSKDAGYLTALLKKDSNYKKGPLPLEAAAAFKRLKAALCSNPVVQQPAVEGDWRVTTDASQGDAKHPGGLGAVLTQVVNGKERVIAYASRSLKKFEKNYSAFLLELSAAAWAIDYWHVYLQGRHFDLYTDHKPLTHLSTIHKKTLNRLQQQLLEHDFTIHYKKGEENVVADALSRNAIEVIDDKCENGFTLSKEQFKDPFCKDVRAYMEKGVLPSNSDAYVKKVIRIAKDSEIVNDVIYYLHKREGMRPVLAALLPESLWHIVTEAAHNSWAAGHGGEERTKQRIFLSYYFPGVHNYVAQYVKRCPNCQIAKGKQPPPAPLQSLPLTMERNERVHIDLFGPMRSTSECGMKYVCVITDAFSKITELCAIPNKQADTVAKCFFERWICRYSVPQILVSDNGKEFANELFKELSTLLGFKHQKTTSYHPQSNSSAESFNRTMKAYLRAMLDNDSTHDWVSQLPMLQLAYNCHVHKSTLESPFWVTYHFDPRLPTFDMDKPRPFYKQDYATSAYETLYETDKRVHANQWDAKKLREVYYNRKAKERIFNVGDRVLFFQNAIPQGVNAKLYKQWQGPYYVTKVIKPLNCVIQRGPNTKELLVHVEKLRHLKEDEYRKEFNSLKKNEEGASSAASFEDFKGKTGDVGSEDFNEEARSGSEILGEAAEEAKDDTKSQGDRAQERAHFVRATRSKVKSEGLQLEQGL